MKNYLKNVEWICDDKEECAKILEYLMFTEINQINGDLSLKNTSINANDGNESISKRVKSIRSFDRKLTIYTEDGTTYEANFMSAFNYFITQS